MTADCRNTSLDCSRLTVETFSRNVVLTYKTRSAASLPAPAVLQTAGAATVAGTAAGSGGSGAGGDAAPALTNHPLEYDPVTNEHTAKMTMARTAALEYYNIGKYAQAEAKFREAVAEAQLGFEPQDPHIASAKNNLAEFLRNTGRWDEAEALYKEALELLERNFGEKHWLFVAALHNLALSYEARGDLAAARASMERVLALRLSMFGPRHFLYADSLFALGHMLLAVPGQGTEGLRMMEDAVRLLEEAAGGRPDLAASALRRAVAHMATDRSEEAAAASALNEQLTEALAAAGQPAAAAAAAEAALAARRKMFGEEALVVAQSEMRVAQQQHAAAGPGPALRALQHAETAARISAANVEECSRGGLLSGPSPERLLKRLRAAHTLGSAAKLVATLAGISPTRRGWSWWPFGSKEGAKAPPSSSPSPAAGEPSGPRLASQVPLPPAEPVAELALADRRLEQAAAALTGAAHAGKQLLQAVGSGRRQLPAGVTVDELAGLLVEVQLQLLDVLERLGQVLQARVAAGQGAAAGGGGSVDVVERHRKVLEQQERVAAELLA
ncbi:kinesin-like protein with TPR domain [Volvox carteri f. nagariensis]|uniref:Kinesin-like protein with TPR domain n=1 Tax=Volvox carteri f. nagariensis TaxID=3068 RepID=D8U5U0_VOLCA|nr:kinesin-like protein with TPR domain [Volvox carteri f. nagariensis]EFJ45058.1 kinesin-like protein with TPR domain [Volvox carteri f. nagariensis]|eukprot:XP_002954029.1 kinesin-like protein with TPR domain [Volvox carteri f. nagariensis]